MDKRELGQWPEGRGKGSLEGGTYSEAEREEKERTDRVS